jgi:hypothetical protein
MAVKKKLKFAKRIKSGSQSEAIYEMTQEQTISGVPLEPTLWYSTLTELGSP